MEIIRKEKDGTVVKVNYKKKIIAKLKKFRLIIFNKTYHRPVSFLTIIEFVKVFGFLAILTLIFYKFFIPR